MKKVPRQIHANMNHNGGIANITNKQLKEVVFDD